MKYWIAIVTLFCIPAAKSGDTVAEMVEKAIPWLEEESNWWIESKQCVSCHHTTFSVWARELALKGDFTVNAEELERDREWVYQRFIAPREPDPDNPDDVVKEGEQNGDRNMEGIAQYLISAKAEDIAPDRKKLLKEIILRNQTSKGNWKPGGQLPLQKRPKPETAAISAVWASLALNNDTRIQSAVSEPKSTEWFAMQALQNRDDESLAKLIARQNPDGGWSWVDGEPSDPTGTGQALLAIGRLGKQAEYPEVISKARAWLATNQLETGIWKTFSTKRRNKSTRVSNFWGTTWAVIGLLESAAP